MNKSKLILALLSTGLFATYAQAADYADIAAAQAAIVDVPETVSPVFLAFLTLGVGAFIIRMVIKYAKKGSSV